MIDGRSFRTDVLFVALVLSLAVLSAQLSFQLRADTFMTLYNAELETLRGRPLMPEFQNRILAPSLLWIVKELAPAGFGPEPVWRLVRFLGAAAAFLVLYGVVLRVTGGRLRALLAVALVTYAYVWTPLSYPAEVTSDFLDIMFIALFVGLAVTERPIALGCVVAIAVTNRESGAFAGLIWIGLAVARHGLHWQQWRRFLPGVVYMALGTAIVAALRYGLSEEFRLHQYTGILFVTSAWFFMFSVSRGLPVIAMTAVAFVIVFRCLPRPWAVEQRGLVLGALACACITLIFGIAFEMRVWLPCWTILSMAAVMGANGQSDRQWLSTLMGRGA